MPEPYAPNTIEKCRHGICDLPYGITQNSWDSIVPLELLWQEYERVVKDNGVVVLTANQPFILLANEVIVLRVLKY